ncbi:hypothetical protein OROMI_033558 [Orobanche minor]
MAGNRKQKKQCFSVFSLFGGKRACKARRRDDDHSDDHVKAYKVYPSDEDRGRWVADPEIDKKASAYIASTTEKWEKFALAEVEPRET